MGGASWKGGSQEIIKPTTTTRFKMEDVCIFYNVIEFFWWKQITKIERKGPFDHLKFHMEDNCVKTHQFVCLDNQTPQLLKGGNDQWSVSCNSSFLWLELLQKQQILKLWKINKVNLFVLDQQWQHQLGCEFHLWWAQCQLVNERNGTWLKEMHVIVPIPHGSWHLVQWQQKCRKLHHGCPYVHCHGHNVKGGHM
jgi:hypothetical protein